MDAIKLEIPARYENGDVFQTIANVYMLNPPFIREEHDYNGDDDADNIEVTYRFVIASDNSKDKFLNTLPNFTPETLLFPCDPVGHITKWGEIGGGYTHTHATALESLGYTIVT